jgi:hypothetical protein
VLGDTGDSHRAAQYPVLGRTVGTGSHRGAQSFTVRQSRSSFRREGHLISASSPPL